MNILEIVNAFKSLKQMNMEFDGENLIVVSKDELIK